MNELLQDVMHDLREKRLLPIAALMVLALIAIPVLLRDSAAEPPPAAAPVAQPGPAEAGPDVSLDTTSAAVSGTGSTLDAFASDDPFTPPKSVTSGAASKDTATAPSGPGADAGAGTGTGGGQPVTEGPGGADPPAQPRPAPAPPTSVAPPRTSEYEYVADVTFWSGERRFERRLRKLDMLPNDRAPVLIFMGATRDGGDTVFLVDSTLATAGEGSCRPSRSNCAYVSLGPGSEHLFTTEEGDSYRLRVDEIRRVKVRPAAPGSNAPRASAADGEPAERRFTLPSLVDLVVETTGGEAAPDSSIPAEGR